MIKLQFVGIDGWDRPVYKDETGKLWKDVNLGRGEPGLHNSSDNSFDGEPDMPIKGEFEFVNGSKYISDDEKKFHYMMLSRLKMDCDFYLGHGNRKNIAQPAEHIEEMKELWNSFSDTEKPEWLTWEQLLLYEKEMLIDCDGFPKQKGEA